MYTDPNSLGDRAKEGRGSERRHTGTGEGISARIHAANSHGDRAEKGRRSDCRHSANSLWERVESCVTLVVGVVVGVSRGRGVKSTIIGCKAIQVNSADCQRIRLPMATHRVNLGRYPRNFVGVLLFFIVVESILLNR